ncbi:hypothetical protein ABZP36_010670 [Zizania latifolia]
MQASCQYAPVGPVLQCGHWPVMRGNDAEAVEKQAQPVSDDKHAVPGAVVGSHSPEWDGGMAGTDGFVGCTLPAGLHRRPVCHGHSYSGRPSPSPPHPSATERQHARCGSGSPVSPSQHIRFVHGHSEASPR